MNRNHLIGAAAVVVAALIAARSWTVVHAQTAPRTTENIPVAPAVPASQNAVIYRFPDGSRGEAVPVTITNQNYIVGNVQAEDDPEMGELAQVEAQASQESAELLSRYAATDNAADQKEIKAKLRTALEDQFKVQLKRQQLELARIEERVKKLREQFKKRTDTRDTIIDRRLEQLINEAEGLGWAQPSGAVPQTSSSLRSQPVRSNMPAKR